MTQQNLDDAAAAWKALQQDMLVAMASGHHHAFVMSLLCRKVSSMLSGAVCAVIDVTDDNYLHVVAAPGLSDRFARTVNKVAARPGAGWGSAAIFNQTPVSCLNIATDPDWADCRDLARELNINACWSIPIKTRDGSTIGHIALYFDVHRAAYEFERQAITNCIDLCAIALETSKAREKLNELAFYDSLTGLSNRGILKSRLSRIFERAVETQQAVGIFYVDIDDFSAVNEIYGQAVGDVLLGRVANRLRSVASQADLIVRMGADDFVVVVSASECADFENIARKIVDGIRDTYVMENGAAISLSASVGVARFPIDSFEEDALIAHAETALRRVRRNGRGFVVFASEMRMEQQKRRVLQRDASLAGSGGQLSVVYQPQADARSAAIGSFEALLRWHHPEFGYISPSDFIPIAESCGAICSMGEFVLREACREAASWPAPLRVAVNVSAAQIVSGNFAKLVAETLKLTRLDPQRLEVEVTESLFINDLDDALVTLNQLKDMGVSVALDDFGTGYSSLSTLRAFPFDRIKIDRSFVFDMTTNSNAAAIVNSVVGLGRAMALTVVAEGVETEEQLNLLRLLGCNVIQGYLIGKPLPAASYAHVTGVSPLAVERQQSAG